MAYEWKSTRLFRHVHVKCSRMLRSGGIDLDETFRGVEFFCMVDTKHDAFTSFPEKKLSIPQPTSTWFFFFSVVVILINHAQSAKIENTKDVGFLIYDCPCLDSFSLLGLMRFTSAYYIYSWFCSNTKNNWESKGIRNLSSTVIFMTKILN